MMKNHKLGILGLFWAMSWSCFAHEPLIFHAHNMNYREIIHKLPELAKNGFTYIQVSPPQKSSDFLPRGIIKDDDQICLQLPVVNHISSCKSPLKAAAIKNHLVIRWDQVFNESGQRVWPKKIWWLHYQPIEYSLGKDTFGSEEDLIELVSVAQKFGIELIADLIVSHTASPPLTDASDWAHSLIGCNIATPSNPKDPDPGKSWWVKDTDYKTMSITDSSQSCPSLKELYQSKLIPICNSIMKTNCGRMLNGKWKLNNYFYPWQYGHSVGGWPCGGGCAALMTLNSDVKVMQQAYVDLLFDAGFKGIRLDAASSVPEETLEWIQQKVTQRGNLFYSEIVPSRQTLVNNQGQRPHLIQSPITDYTFMTKLKDSLSYKGDWNVVVNYITTTLKPNDIVFCETHDTLGGELKSFKMSDVQEKLPNNQIFIHENNISDDHILGQYLILTMGKGIPLILNSYLDPEYLNQHYKNIYYAHNSPYIKSTTYILNKQNQAFQFRKAMQNYRTSFRIEGDVIIIFKLTNQNALVGFAAINKAGEVKEILIGGRSYYVPPRDALFIF